MISLMLHASLYPFLNESREKGAATLGRDSKELLKKEKGPRDVKCR